MNHFTRALPLLALLLTPACGSGQDLTTVASAAGLDLSVDEMAALIAPHSNLPAQPEVVQALADLWVDYVLLATAAADDSTMSHIDVSPLARDLVEERLIVALRDSVIQIEPLSDAELNRLYATDAPGSFVRGRQILLRWPAAATEAQRDSVRSAAADLRRRIVDDGEDFGAVASTESDDASAGQGGDIGVVTRGQLVEPLQETLFSLAVGDVSQPVESPFGVHLLKAEEHPLPTLDQYRTIVMNRRVAEAESTYVRVLEEAAHPQVSAGAANVVRELARDPRLRNGNENDALVRYAGGTVTRGEVRTHLQNQAPQLRNQIVLAEGESVPLRVLDGLVRRELLVAEARRRGWAIRPEIAEGLIQAAQRNLAEAARQMDLHPLTFESPAERGAVIETAVNDLLTGILTGTRREVTPLGPMSHILRSQYPSSTNPMAAVAVVNRVNALRAGVTPADTPR